MRFFEFRKTLILLLILTNTFLRCCSNFWWCFTISFRAK